MSDAQILIVEDEQAHADRLVSALRSGGFAPELAMTYDDAVKLTDEKDFDLIVLDRRLGDRDGLELCQHLNNTGSLSRIVFFTSMNEPTDHAEGWAAGADDYVFKEASVETLLARCTFHLANPTRRMLHAKALRLEHDDVAPEDHVIISESEGLICKAKHLDLVRRGRRERVVRRTPEFKAANIRGMEISVFLYLNEMDGDWVTEEELLRRVWGVDDVYFDGIEEHPDLDTGVVHVTIYRLRQKLDTKRRGEGADGRARKRLGYCYIEHDQEYEDGARYRLHVDRQRLVGE